MSHQQSGWSIFIGGAFLLFGLGACSDDGDGFNQGEDEAKLEASRAEIRSFVANTRCSESSECRAIDFGSKPCGGAWEYLVYSEATVDPADLEAMVAEHNRFENTLNSRYGYVSDCSVPSLPALDCRESRCSSTADPQGDTYALDEEFSLQFGQVARLQGDETAFRFESVKSDSRCPSDVQCVWAGEVTVEIRWLEPSTGENALLSLGSGDTPSWVRQGETIVRLVEVLPYPRTTHSGSETIQAVFRFESSGTP